MFSTTALHQQLALPLSTLAQHVRTLSLTPRRCQSRHRIASAQDAIDTTNSKKQKLEDKPHNKVERTTDEIEILLPDLHTDFLPALGKLLRQKQRSQEHWRASHVSTESFFENKNGFPISELSHPHTRRTILTGSLFSGHRRHNIGYNVQQIRGFGLFTNSTPRGVNEYNEYGKQIGSTRRQERDVEETSVSGRKGRGGNSKRNRQTEQQKDSFSKKFFPTLGQAMMWTIIILVGIQLWRTFVVKNEVGEFVDKSSVDVRFTDVKGIDEELNELQEIVNFLTEPEKYQKVGAKLPKGVLMIGEPGVGKTLMAKAVAGEAGVPFYHASGSQFDEMFVGLGARRIRNLFAQARQQKPCVIFIDEIDTVGAKRTSSTIHPYANQTVNQLLAEMDGFAHSEGVIVLAATNKPDNLDPALLRPGRFDLQIVVPKPDKKGRYDLFELYTKKVQLDSDVDCEKLARVTVGFTGADICNLVNQAAVKAGQENLDMVAMEHFEHALDKMKMGAAKNRVMDSKDVENTAYHEAGHALVAYYTEGAIPLHKVTILPRGMALGFTAFAPVKDEVSQSKMQLKARMDVAMGGHVAEELRYGKENVTTGGSEDFRMATGIAEQMVRTYGMSDKVGKRSIEQKHLSEATKQLVDQEINKLLQDSYERAMKILTERSKEHAALANALLKYETLNASEIDIIVKGKKLEKVLTPKTKKQNDKPPGPIGLNIGIYTPTNKDI